MDIPATGSRIFVEGITIHHVTNGKILDSHARWDTLDLLRQLGEVCALGETGAVVSMVRPSTQLEPTSH
jgi:hypothetical protein